MNTSYTGHLENNLWDFAYSMDDTYESEEHYEIIDYLNASSNFRSFGDGLFNVIQRKYPEEAIDTSNVIPFINQKCADNGVPIANIASQNTLTNWFKKDMRPKKADTSRQSMFALAFALGLTVEETKDLFHKVYLDRAFNYRNETEIIYYYCLQHQRTWTDAERLVAAVGKSSSTEPSETRYTAIIKGEIEQIDDDNELIAYIAEHSSDFEKDSKTAKEEFNRLFEQAKVTAQKEIEKGKTEYQEVIENKWHSEDSFSANLLYEIILGFNVSGKKGTKTIFGKSHLPKEIKNRFPEAASFSRKDIGSEELRKVIILLFSYITWYQMQENDADYGYDDYKEQLDALLSDCNYSNMCYGNPYDWLFLYCTLFESSEEIGAQPLVTFREIIAEALGVE